MKFRWCRVFLGCTLLLLAVQSGFGRIPIEQAQREFQGRYYFATGLYATWPACACSGTPAPAFPRDNFYGDLDTNPALAALLVQDLARQFYESSSYANSSLYAKFLRSPDGVLGIDGETNAPASGSAADFPSFVGGIDMAADPGSIGVTNYAECFAVLRAYIKNLNAVYAGAECINGLDKQGSGQGTSCPEATAEARRNWSSYEAPSTRGRIVSLSQEWITADTNASSPYGAFEESTRGTLYLDISGAYPQYTSGRVIGYVRATAEPGGVDPNQPAFRVDSTFRKLAPESISGPSAVYTKTLADSEPVFSGNCSTESLSRGWSIENSDHFCVILPDFQTDPDNVHCGDGACASCSAGNSNIPGATRTRTGSMDVQISLGPDLYGNSAGYFYLHGDQPSSDLFTPAALRLARSTNTIVFPENGPIQQVSTPNITATVQALAAGFAINFTDNVSSQVCASVTITNNGDLNQVFISEVLGANGSPRLVRFNYTPASGTWDMVEGNGLRTESRSTVWSDLTNRTDTILIKDAAGNAVRQTTEQYVEFPWGLTLVRQTLGTGSTARTTTWTYFTDPATTNTYGQLSQMVEPSGRWEKYQYDFAGRLTQTVAQFCDNGTDTADAANRVTTLGYDDQHCIITNIVNLAGQEITRTYELHSIEADQANGDLEKIQTIRCTQPGAAISAAGNLTNIVWRTTGTTPTGVAWDPVAELNPDGTMTLHSYQNGHEQITSRTGVPNKSWAEIVMTPFWANALAVIDGTETAATYGTWGEPLLEQTHDIATGIQTDLKTYSGYDDLRRSHSVTYFDQTSESFFYSCCGLDTTVDRDGVTNKFYYDAAKRQTASWRLGITTTNILDAAGQALQTLRIGSNNVPTLFKGAAYDLNGELLSETNALLGVTYHSKTLNGQGQTVVADTFPDDGTRIVTYFQDGSICSMGGTAAQPMQYLYGATAEGAYTTQIRLDAAGGTNEWTQDFTDCAGRPFKTVFAAASGSPFSVSYFNSKGQLTNQVDPDGVSKLFAYTPKGELAYTIVDSNRNYQIDWTGADRITLVTNDIVQDQGDVVRRSRTFVWSTEANTPTLVSSSETAVTGLAAWSTVYNGGNAVTSSNVTVYTGSGHRYVTNTAPDASYTVSHFLYGRLLSTTRKDQNNDLLPQTSYGYDFLGRQSSSTDARNGTTTFYFNNADQITGTLSPSPGLGQPPQLTTFYFDNMGRNVGTTLPDSTSVTNILYPTGLPQLTYGSRTYPAGYSYDAQGRLKTMTNWSGLDWSGARVTTWNYDVYRGWLTNKTFAGGAAGPRYTYTPAGRLASRTWVRGVVTSYYYTGAGDLASVAYNDCLDPGLTFTYDRRGRQSTVRQVGSITATRSYDDANDLLSESWTGGPIGGISVTNGFDLLLRRTNLALNSQLSTLSSASFGYDAASRLHTVTQGSSVATYTYVANSPLVSQVVLQQSGAPGMTISKQFDFLNRLTSISSTPAAAVPASSRYNYNSANQRSRVTLGDGSYWLFNYDSLGQVTGGSKYWPDGSPVAGQQFGYAFDSIGNRTSALTGGDENGANQRLANYTANPLNQYTSREVPDRAEVIGLALATNSVSVNAQAPYRKGEYFRKELKLDNSTSPVWQSVKVSAPNETSVMGSVFVPRSPESYSYDADGNLTQDGRWQYTWDHENRLVSMQAISTVPTAAKLKLDFTYDYQGRRIQKIVSTNNGSVYVPQYTNAFAYDGWNLVAVLSPSGSLLRSFAWGLDVSGSEKGAGGVGGLLMVNDAAQGVQFLAFDGSGNVEALVKAADGTVSANYEYGPFGEALRVTGPMAKANPFRFSTKYQDDESDLLYYGYRYYSASTGRWVSRDPAEEEASIALYAFVGDNPIQFIDPLGEAVFSPDFVGPLLPPDFYGTPVRDPSTPGNARADRERYARQVMNQFADLQRRNPGKCCKLDACSLAAQWMAESNWGRSGLARDARNLGGIKGNGPAGSYNAKTREFDNGAEIQTTGNFRAYNSYPEFYADYATLICQGSRYSSARGKKGRAYYEALKQAGYSTNPAYADQMMQFYRQLGCK